MSGLDSPRSPTLSNETDDLGNDEGQNREQRRRRRDPGRDPPPSLLTRQPEHELVELLSLTLRSDRVALADRPPRRRVVVTPATAHSLLLSEGQRHGRNCNQARLSAPLPRLLLMADSSLTVRDRESFLAEPHVAAFSVWAGEDRGPFTVPIWYQYTPGGEAWVLTEARSRKVRLIEAAGRFTLMVERIMPTTRYVSVEGPVTRTAPGTDELLREITARYLPPDRVPAYIEFANSELGEQVAIYLRPERWLTADLGPGALPPGWPEPT